MKTISISFFAFILSFWILPAQNLDLIYSITQENLRGNSRYEAMSSEYLPSRSLLASICVAISVLDLRMEACRTLT